MGMRCVFAGLERVADPGRRLWGLIDEARSQKRTILCRGCRVGNAIHERCYRAGSIGRGAATSFGRAWALGAGAQVRVALFWVAFARPKPARPKPESSHAAP